MDNEYFRGAELFLQDAHHLQLGQPHDGAVGHRRGSCMRTGCPRASSPRKITAPDGDHRLLPIQGNQVSFTFPVLDVIDGVFPGPPGRRPGLFLRYRVIVFAPFALARNAYGSNGVCRVFLPIPLPCLYPPKIAREVKAVKMLRPWQCGIRSNPGTDELY